MNGHREQTAGMTQPTDGGLSPAMRRTAGFLAVGAGLLLLGGWLNLRPSLRQRAVVGEAEQAKVLFPELADAAKAASLEIVSFDDETATLKPFKVVRSGGVWVLPSHENYPADAKDQLAAAATELIDRPVLDVVSDSPGDHETYGVIEPDPEKIKVGMTGVGQLVEIRDASGNKLARLIVGKEDKRPAGAAGAGGRSLRFVRRAGQDRVYRVELDTSKFSTKFDDWIEKDLLKLSPWDVRQLTLDDSTCSFGADEATGRLKVSLDRNSIAELAYDDKDAKWSLLKLESFDDKNQPKPDKLTDDEELASGKLNDLRNALGDLKIVDVVRKPSGLSADLKAEEKFTGDREAVTSLAQRGFFAFQQGDIVSSNGETVVGMKDGVEYLLRFGNGTTVAGEGKAAEKTAEDAAKPEEVESTGRYLFVTARFNEGLLTKPALDPLPEAPAEGDAAKKDEKKEEEKGADKTDTKDGATGEKAAGAVDELKKAEEAEAKAQAALEERRRVEAENRRKQEQYDDQVKAAQKRIRELNNRFADWYYVVSDEEFAKIHLGRAAIVQKKEAAADAKK
ncbi:MAG: DUF4340 domain-containing protein [Planctomycetia bacterium]|nr:DUF4340 domain-containing protein [Planctomycetia bacterium]